MNAVVREEDPKRSETEFKCLYDQDHGGPWRPYAADRYWKMMLAGER